MNIKIITTEDGSHSLLNEELNETYHSTRGAKGESLHVFIEEGLRYYLSNRKNEVIRILEVGMGSGLNALLTANFATQKGQRIEFTSLEPYPISKAIYSNLNYAKNETDQALLEQIHESSWEVMIEIAPHFAIHKIGSTLEAFASLQSFQVVYFDAFAPVKQPSVWVLSNLKKCFGLMDTGGVLTTYCAQGQFKRNLASAGFEVQTLKGAMGKKEMVRGIKP